MSNTKIQIKRSTTTAIPPNGTLSAGELAISYSSNVLYSGTSDGNGIIPLGGLTYVNKTNSAYDIAIAAFGVANTASANAGTDLAVAAFNKANAANVLAYETGIGANAYLLAVISGANTAVGAGANAYANLVWSRSNTYADAVGTSANAYLLAVIAGANTSVGTGANTYADQTFVKLTAANQTITGNISVVGNLTIAGNTVFANTETLRITDPLLYLAGNNYTSDIVDIGFIGNYVNATGSNVHTGFYREHTSKEYYLFQEYNEEPNYNHIDPTANGFALSVLNAHIKTSNLSLGGVNAIVWITSAYDKANAANTLAYDTGIGANAYAAVVGTAANTYSTNMNNASAGKLAVQYGGTGLDTVANNGVLFGSVTSALRVTAAGTEGQVLQANEYGTPFFGILDGGNF